MRALRMMLSAAARALVMVFSFFVGGRSPFRPPSSYRMCHAIIRSFTAMASTVGSAFAMICASISGAWCSNRRLGERGGGRDDVLCSRRQT